MNWTVVESEGEKEKQPGHIELVPITFPFKNPGNRSMTKFNCNRKLALLQNETWKLLESSREAQSKQTTLMRFVWLPCDRRQNKHFTSNDDQNITDHIVLWKWCQWKHILTLQRPRKWQQSDRLSRKMHQFWRFYCTMKHPMNGTHVVHKEYSMFEMSVFKYLLYDKESKA